MFNIASLVYSAVRGVFWSPMNISQMSVFLEDLVVCGVITEAFGGATEYKALRTI